MLINRTRPNEGVDILLYDWVGWLIYCAVVSPQVTLARAECGRPNVGTLYILIFLRRNNSSLEMSP
jgi:hypothetical protein